MFKTPQDLARASLRLIALSTSAAVVTDEDKAALELSAATLANHVADWHHKDKFRRDSAAGDQFAMRYPDWDVLREISNGTKHAKLEFETGTDMREPKWEDKDFWYGFHGTERRTLFVDVEGHTRSVRALVWTFCEKYLKEET